MVQRWPLLLAALWWGGMSALSFVAVPLLFAHFGTPAVAGPAAAKLFQFQAWFSVAVCLVLLVAARQPRWGIPATLAQALLPWLLLAALAALVQQFGVAQKIVTARAMGSDVRLWHHVGSGLVVLQWLCALRVLWCLADKPASSL